MRPEQVCEEVLASGLRGRGGGGFPTGKKWALTLPEPSREEVRHLQRRRGRPRRVHGPQSSWRAIPHRVLEGMMIAARAIGADEAYVYVRAEYPLAVQRIRKAVADAEEARHPGRRRFRQRAEHRLSRDGRGRCVRLRRGDRADGLDRGAAGHASTEASVPRPERAVGQAHGDQQRRDAGDGPADHARRAATTIAGSGRRARPGPRPSP